MNKRNFFQPIFDLYPMAIGRFSTGVEKKLPLTKQSSKNYVSGWKPCTFFIVPVFFSSFERTDQNEDSDEVANCSSMFFSVSLFNWHNFALPSEKVRRKLVSLKREGVSAKRLHKDLGTRQGQKVHQKSWPKFLGPHDFLWGDSWNFVYLPTAFMKLNLSHYTKNPLVQWTLAFF